MKRSLEDGRRRDELAVRRGRVMMAEERRHAEDTLGETIYAAFPVHTRAAVVTAHALLERGEISEHELETKMNDVRARFQRA